MGMNFTVNIKADFATDLDADTVLQTWDVDKDMLNIGGNASIDVNEVSGSVHIGGTIEVEDFEVSAQDLEDFDAEGALEDEYGNLELTSSDFDITESPTGFERVEQATDRETAITVYAALASNGFEVV